MARRSEGSVGVSVYEYHDGKLKNVWTGPEEAAAGHHVHPSTIKELIYYGTPLPFSASPLITFDLDPASEYDVVKVSGDRRKSYRIVRMSDGCYVDEAD